LIPKPPLREGLSFSQAVYDRNGKLLRLTLSSDEIYRLWLPLSNFSSNLIETTLLREDRFFRWHPGFNPIALSYAAWQTYVCNKRIGGSTITMQLARLRFKIRTRTIMGKLYQILRAIQIECHYSKDAILEAYLNLAPYGGNIEGAGAASLIYFGKEAKDLTIVEAITLAVIPQSPTKRTPYSNNREQKLSSEFRNARRSLLLKWVKKHPLDSIELHALKLPISINGPDVLPFFSPHFTDALLSDDEQRTGRIYTTLNLEFQNLLERQIRNYIETQQKIGIYNASALLIDYQTMEILAAVGSANYFNDAIQGQVNGFRAKRSPGSALKPFIYALGMDQGIIHPMTMLKDAPSSFGGFNPENFDGEFQGPIKVRDALIRSRNVPAMQVASQLDNPDFFTFLKDSGINFPHNSSYYGLAPVLGGAEITMEDLIKLYAMLGNKGVLRQLRNRIDLFPAGEQRLLSEESCLLVLDILKDIPRPNQGYHREWLCDSIPVHWKTGTSFAFRDAWAVGIFGQYALAVWVGNFNGEGNPAFVGITGAAPLFFEIVDALKSDTQEQYSNNPLISDNISKVKVCAVSGFLPGPFCPNLIDTWFIPGKSPIKHCTIHRQVFVDSKTGLRTSPDDSKNIETLVCEFWPSDILKIFEQAGIPRRLPPPYDPTLMLESCSSTSGNAPQIISPNSALTYNFRINSIKDQTIPFTAVTDADVKQIYWFADSSYLTRKNAGENYFWKPKIGHSVIRVVDDHGRSDSQSINVEVVK